MTQLLTIQLKIWVEKWYAAGEISKEWKDYIHIQNAQTGKNAMLYKTHKPGNPIHLLTSGCNTTKEHLSPYMESICSPLTQGMPRQIKDTAHLLNIIDDLNKDYISDNYILVSFDIVNMYPSIDNVNKTSINRMYNRRVKNLLIPQ